MRIAIIGSGIAGLVCAYVLNRLHDITVFEANVGVGGHTHTVKTPLGHSVDTGFIVVFVYRRSGSIFAVERSGLLSTVLDCCQR